MNKDMNMQQNDGDSEMENNESNKNTRSPNNTSPMVEAPAKKPNREKIQAPSMTETTPTKMQMPSLHNEQCR